MKSLLIPFFDDDAALSALSHAVMIAKRFNSHIEGMFVSPGPQVLDSGLGIPMVVPYAIEAGKQGALLAERAKSRFESVLTQQDIKMSPINEDSSTVSARWRDFENSKNPLLGDDGRVFDMIVVGRGFGHQWTDWSTICESALFESGRPVLITPQEIGSIGEHAAIAWNGSTETARTIALSMPILLKTKKVTVMTLDGWSVPGPDGGQLVNNLLRNGINATLTDIDLDGRTPGQAIVEEAIDTGADMLVKGAYTQSRLRQLVFGGATRHILHKANLPVIMAH
jgi:nucleotide-binding universal stress UspA family protein